MRGLKTLRMASHNVRGLAPKRWSEKTALIGRRWINMGLGIVCVQELKMKKCIFNIAQMNRKLPQWEIFWGFNTTTADAKSAGVAILIRKKLLKQGLKIVGAPVVHGNDGRLMHMKVEWGGHKIQIINAYLPNNSTEQRKFIDERLATISIDMTSMQVWAGDYNFVENPSLDRIVRTNGTITSPRKTSSSIGKHWQSKFPQLKDALRVKKPTSRQLTHFDYNGAARLDRLYVSANHQQYIVRAGTDSKTPLGTAWSDHLPATVELLGKTAGRKNAPRKKLFRARMWFAEVEELEVEFSNFLEEGVNQSEEMDKEELIEHFPKFKKQITGKMVELNKRQREMQQEQDAADENNFHTMWQTLCDVDTTEVSAAQEAEHVFQQYMQAHESRASAAEKRAKAHAAKTRKLNLHSNERPNAKLTAIINPKPKTAINAIKSAAGTLATTNAGCAQVLTRHYANISKQPLRDESSQEQVLDKLKPNLTEPIPADLGSAPITEAEVKFAIKHMKPSTAPGMDGIQINLYQKYKHILVPLLTRVYNAMFELNKVPKQLLDGLIIPLYKQDGDLTEAVNYRPITLLGTDYRILAKVLSNRLQPYLQKLISPSQTAFVPGRKIGENIITLKLLAKILKKRMKTVLVGVCDIKKAYDTVDREFLLKAMEKLGIPQSYIKWVKLLLSDTKAAAVVHGEIAQLIMFDAGVRQGCPLSPALYLFIGEVMVQVLKEAGVGITIDTPDGAFELVAVQFADDLKAMLKDEEQVLKFKEAMQLIKSAVNQELQERKSTLLSIGKTPGEGLPSEIHGFAVKKSAKALGIIFKDGDQEAVAHWENTQTQPQGALIEKLEKRCDNLANCNLSMFGRAFCTASYLTSVLLYHATFVTLPKTAQKKAENCVARLVNRNIGTIAGGRRFTSVRADLLPGHPTTGGFGVLPLTQHINARRAKWMLELTSGGNQPWKRLAMTAIGDANPNSPAKATLLKLLDKANNNRNIITALPQTLQMMVEALYCLPRLVPLKLQPGDWCYAAPVFQNPALRIAANSLRDLDRDFQDIALTNIKTVGQLVEASRAVNTIPPRSHQQYKQIATTVFGSIERWCWGLPDQETAGKRLMDLLSNIPPEWVQAAYNVSRQVRDGTYSGEVPKIDTAIDIIISSLGWEINSSKTMDMEDYTVKWGTLQQLGDLQKARLPKLITYAVLAGSGTSAAMVLDFMKRSWKLKWENNYKEILWLLAHNGIPVAQRMRSIGETEVCVCGETCPGRGHHYWDCPVLNALKDTITAQLNGEYSGVTLQRKHIWLGIKPSNAIQECVWTTVSLAALNAMNTARTLIRRKLAGSSAHMQSTQLVQQATNAAITKFWSLLANFVGLNHTQSCWKRVQVGHPFLHWHENKLRVNKT